jgi:hypothetical protein
MQAFQAYDQGKDAVGHGTADAPRWNARLYFPWNDGSGPSTNLWVYDVSMDFGLSGATAQSAKIRSFFAHNSNPPVITVQCQAPNQYVYGKTIEFMQDSQRGFSDLAYLHIGGGGFPANNTTRGQHKAISAEGYVEAVRRRHDNQQRGAQDFTFSFVTAFMHQPFPDTAYDPPPQLSWKDVVDKIIANDKNAGFAANPDNRPKVHNPDPALPDDPIKDHFGPNG